VIYSGGAHQSYAAIARLCCDPRMSIDERWWAWLQIQPLLSSIPQADVAAIQGTQGPRTGLNTPRGGSHNGIPVVTPRRGRHGRPSALDEQTPWQRTIEGHVTTAAYVVARADRRRARGTAA